MKDLDKLAQCFEVAGGGTAGAEGLTADMRRIRRRHVFESWSRQNSSWMLYMTRQIKELQRCWPTGQYTRTSFWSMSVAYASQSADLLQPY